MKKYSIKLLLIFITLVTFSSACKKYLEAKPDISLATPERLDDLQAILDYTPHMLISAGSDECSADNYTIGLNSYNAISEQQRRLYTFQPDHLFASTASDWGFTYRKIYIANTVLDGLTAISVTTGDDLQRKNLEGQALMVRGSTLFTIVNIWAPAYDQATATKDLGIPLRLSADFSERSVRASVQESYDRIILDLKASIPLLPGIAISPARASKAAAYAWLSRVYLAMRNYRDAGLYADSSLQLQNKLLDYNTLDSTANFPFPKNNPEITFLLFSGSQLTSTNIARIDPELYASYEPKDLRRGLFFRPNGEGYPVYKGNYTGTYSQFAGLATDEIYLTRSECFARAGNTQAALDDLNTLLVKRFQAGTFIPLTSTNNAAVLKLILAERRKELVMRYVRFMDIKRLNKEGAGITITRSLDGKTYTLVPNDLRYALALPEDVLALTGMPQNPR